MRLITVLLVALVLSVGCGKDDGPQPVPAPQDVSFQVSGKHISVSATVLASSKVPAKDVEMAVKFAVSALEE